MWFSPNFRQIEGSPRTFTGFRKTHINRKSAFYSKSTTFHRTKKTLRRKKRLWFVHDVKLQRASFLHCKVKDSYRTDQQSSIACLLQSQLKIQWFFKENFQKDLWFVAVKFLIALISGVLLRGWSNIAPNVTPKFRYFPWLREYCFVSNYKLCS